MFFRLKKYGKNLAHKIKNQRKERWSVGRRSRVAR
jgi:hypothetical protein